MADLTELTQPESNILKRPINWKSNVLRIVAIEAWGILLLAITIVYTLGLTGLGGPAGELLLRLTTPVFGFVGSIFLAIALAIGTAHLLMAARFDLIKRLTKLVFISLPLVLGIWECGLHFGRFYWDEHALKLTGYLGLWTGRLLRLLVGDSSIPVALVLLTAVVFVVMKINPIVALKLGWGILTRPRKHAKDVDTFVYEPLTALPAMQAESLEPETECVDCDIYDQMVETESGPSGSHKTSKAKVPPGSQLDLGLNDAPKLPKSRNYKLPPLDLLAPPSPPVVDDDYREFAAQRIVKTLETFGISCKVSDVITGPAVTRVEVVLGEGIRVNKVEGMEKDIAYILPAKRVRVEAPIPGKTAIGIEFPNMRTNIVRLKELLMVPEWNKARAPLTMALAKDLNNLPVLTDLGKMPHLLVAGQTGSGKSVCLHSIIVSLLYRLSPDQLRLILIDPKMVEFGHYEGLPHLLTPVVNEVTDAINALRWSVQEMRDRYRKLKGKKARNIMAYNALVPASERMPFIVIIIDEMADLMAQEGYEIEACITSLTQLARAVGIHLVLATQRPSVKIITGNIKANIPARIALNVASYNDSRTILDYKGAESLLGNGDMLYKAIDEDTPIRAQGSYVDDDEIKRVVEFLSGQGAPEYDDDVTADHAPSKPSKGSGDSPDLSAIDASVLQGAIKVFLNEGEASTSMLQSKLGLGYPRARRLMEQLEGQGLVGPKNGSKPREIKYGACREVLTGTDPDPLDIEMLAENNVDQILSEM
jgi:DNA segregation ATPase FtsK/SpoIIIE, S-DNA-T family